MKKFIVILALTGLLLLACGGGEEQTDQPVDTAEIEEGTDEGQTETVETIEETPPPPLYPDGTLDPSQITVDTPVSAAALFSSYFAWKGKEVTVEGYPFISYSADSMIVASEIRLISEPRTSSWDVLLSAEFTDSCGATIWADDPITITGTIDYYWTGDLQLVDCAIVQDAPAAQAGLETSPYAYDGVTPILVAELFEMFNVWMGKELIVEGYYNSTTTSTTDYGVTVRVDLSDPDDTYTKYVACEMIDEIPEEVNSLMVENREGTLIRGTLAGESFDMVGLDSCVIVNR